MASTLYTKAKEGLMSGAFNLINDDIRVILIDTADYTANLATDEFLSSIPGAARVAVSGALTGKSITGGVFNATNVSFGAVSGDQSEALVLYKHTGNDATARLILYIDSGTGLPVLPNGGPIDINWDTGSNKIFKL